MQPAHPRSVAAVAGHIDTTRFPAHLSDELARALQYLQQSLTLRAVLRRLAASGNVVFIEYHCAHTKFLHRNGANLRIQWNPRLGLRDVTGWLSPAILLGHEFGHAQFTAAERASMFREDRPQGFQCEAFGVEEAHVIAHVERPACLELNAARRRAGLPALETAQRCQHQLGHLIEVSEPLSASPWIAAC